jgi:hypothetical protein
LQRYVGFTVALYAAKVVAFDSEDLMRTTLIALGCAAGLAGCATPYQEMGVLGGVSSARITMDTFQITARGNGWTDPDTVQRYALRKAAEQTVAAGYDLFAIAGDADRSSAVTETFATSGHGRRGGWLTGSSFQMIRPGETLLVRMARYPKPEPLPPGMFDAHEVLKFLAPGGPTVPPLARKLR